MSNAHVLACSFDDFWQRHPALWCGLFFYVGALCSLAPTNSLVLLVLFLLIPPFVSSTYESKKRIALAVCCTALSYAFVSITVILPPKGDTELSGKGHVIVENVSCRYHYGKSFYKLNVLIKHFTPFSKGYSVQNLPAELVIQAAHERPRGGYEYEVSGKLSQKRGKWFFTPYPKSSWTPAKSFFSFVEFRFKAKKKVVQMLAAIFPPSTTRNFLEGVLVGEYHDPKLKMSLMRFGLQHILVVSGFHFALLVAIFASLVRLCTHSSFASVFLLILTTCYFLFIGSQASVFRAYIAISICLFGKLLGRDSSGINALGLGLLLVGFFEPLMCLQVGFQLSFLATWAILILFPVMKQLLFSFWPRYTLEILSEASFFEQAVFVLSTFFLTALSLICSVTIFCLPMTLYAFGQFPLWGIFYNLFFPFGVSLAITCVCIGFLLYPLTLIANAFWSTGACVLDGLLTLVEHMPSALDVVIASPYMPVEALVLYFCTVSSFAICYRVKHQESVTVISSTQNL